MRVSLFFEILGTTQKLFVLTIVLCGLSVNERQFMVQAIRSVREAILEGPLFFKIVAPIPVVGKIIEVRNTQRLFKEFTSSYVFLPNTPDSERKDISQRSIVKLERLLHFMTDVTTTHSSWINRALLIASFALIIIFTPSSATVGGIFGLYGMFSSYQQLIHAPAIMACVQNCANGMDESARKQAFTLLSSYQKCAQNSYLLL